MEEERIEVDAEVDDERDEARRDVDGIAAFG